MSIGRMFAIVLIFIVGAGGWFVLGGANHVRATGSDSRLGESVQGLWGRELIQYAPKISRRIPGVKQREIVSASASRIRADVNLEYRRKGLLWFSTYEVRFEAEYTLSNTGPVRDQLYFHLALPDPNGTYVGLHLAVDGSEVALPSNPANGLVQRVEIAPGASRLVRVGYTTRGINEWRYRPGVSHTVKNLDLELTTNFTDVDFAEGSLSPMDTSNLDGEVTLRWQADELLTTRDVALLMPQRLNPGPIAARMSFFAPVGLLFFFVLLTAISLLRKVNIHPMHYLFVTAGFFAFHLLFAYLVGAISTMLAFAIAAVVSLVLVGSYLAVALGRSYPWLAGSIGQLFYLVLFSYSFFLDGATGLTVTIGAVLTLTVLMILTAKTDWNEIWSKPTQRVSETELELDAQLPAS